MAQNRFTPERIVIAVVAVVVVASVAMLIRRGVERTRQDTPPEPAPPSVAPATPAQPEMRATILMSGDAVYALALTPDGKHLFIAGSDRIRDQPVVRVWDIAAARVVAVLTRDGEIGRHVTVAVSPDGKSIAAGGVTVPGEGSVVGNVAVWDFATRKPRWSATVTTGRVECLAWSPSGDRLAGGDLIGGVAIWDAASGEVKSTWPAKEGQRSPITALAWSRDGKQLAINTGSDVRVREAVDGQERARTDRTGAYSVAFGPDDRTLFVTAVLPGELRVWDLTEKRIVRAISTRHTFASGLAVGPGGRSLVTIAHSGLDAPTAGLTVCGWDVASGGERWSLFLPTDDIRGSPCPFAVTPDGRLLGVATAEQFVWTMRLYELPP